MSVNVFCSLSHWVACFIAVEFVSSLNVLDTGPLSDMEFANMVSQSVAFLVILLWSFIIEQKSFNFDKIEFISVFV